MSSDLLPDHYVTNIARSGLSIYDPIVIGNPLLWIPAPELETLLDRELTGTKLRGLPLRTRSKIVKSAVCKALGYPVPPSFKRTQPRFPGQMFDTYVQKSNNLQIWNEELAATRRYVLIRVAGDDQIVRVKVVTGDALAKLDTTGTLTQKYQARLICGTESAELVSPEDTDTVWPMTTMESDTATKDSSPTSNPEAGSVLPIATLFKRLRRMIGISFKDQGHDQERRRGADLHKLVSEYLGYADYSDDGQFPDVRNQLLEIKLQTAATIDLGLVTPDSTEPLDLPMSAGDQIRHCDVRYAIFYGKTDGVHVTITHLFLTTGERFFTRFPRFQGKVLNKKLQIPLPKTFFD